MVLLITALFIYIFMHMSNSLCAEITEKNVLSNLTKRGDSEFVFLYPRTFLAGKNETVCTVLQGKYFPARIKITLKVKHKQFSFNEVLNSEAECFNLSVPLHRSLEIMSGDLLIYLEMAGKVYVEKNYESIPIYPPTDVIFMETDRHIYAPGDNVKIRIIILSQDMLPNTKNSTDIDIKISNPQGFTVHARKLSTHLGMVHFDYQLANETTFGTWNIEFNSYRKSFIVKKFMLPRFKIYISGPNGIYTQASYLKFKVCARYTFGNGLRGYSFAKITYLHDINFSLSKLQELSSDGCTDFLYQNNELSLSKHHLKSNTMKVFVTVTEDGTNQMMTETMQINIYPKPYDMKLLTEAEASYYQPGLPYKNRLKIIRGFLNDYSKEYAEICCQIAWKHEWNLKAPECESFQFDKDGVIPFSILPLKENVKYVKITAKSLNHTTVSANALILHRWYSTSYLKIDRNSRLYTKCKSPQQFTVYFTINKLKHNEHITFYYMISSNNGILLLKKHYHIVNKTFIDFESEIGNSIPTHKNYTKMENYVNKFVIKFKTHDQINSKGQLTVFYFNKGETISNSINIHVEKCLSLNVTAKWASTSIHPRNSGKLVIKTKKQALCSISSVDIANSFLDSNKRLTVSKFLQPFVVRREFKMKKPNCVFEGGQFKDVMLPESLKGFNYSRGFDTFEDFNNAGIAVITNTEILLKPCKQHDDLVAPYYQIITDDEYDKAEDDKNIIRSYFPATWHWDLIHTDKSGMAVLQSIAPDSITTWNTNIICTSNDGVGVTNLKLVTIKSFFVDFVIPQSMKRYEILNLQIAAHNYYNYSLPVQLTLNTSLEVLSQESLKDVINIPANEVVVKSIRLRAAEISTEHISVKIKLSYNNKDWTSSYFETNDIIDIIEKYIKVGYEGYSQVKPKSILLCGTTEKRNLTWNLDISGNYIKGSESIGVVLHSDLMGPVFHNLEELIILPTGCGEQIMAVMAPNFYVLKYLKSINNLLPYIRKRIFKNLQIGYQKILGFLHDDGSFSAFGHNDATGSMFLTTFVLRSLSSASEYIFVDQLIISNALEWILKHQLENGCFASVSHVFQDMGGAGMENSTSALTSYVMISLLESKSNISEETRLNAVFCIRGQFNPDTFSLAINTYALYLLRAEADADAGLNLLILGANRNNNFMWWNSTRDSKSMNIETTSYVLMSLMHKLSNDHLIYANAIVRWLLSQRNAQGGFISSQDTVVALDAISRYTSIMNERNPVMHISIATDGVAYNTDFKKGESLKKEEFYFHQESKKVHLSYNGTGCVLTQLLLHYNVDSPRNNEAFELNINPISTTSNCLISTLTPCFKYNNEKQRTMIVMEIFMPSGYDSEKSSLHQIVGTHKNLKKVEEFSNKLVFYFTDLATETVCLPFNISRTAMVSKLYNSTILLYEYYNPDRQIIKAYNLPNECSTIL